MFKLGSYKMVLKNSSVYDNALKFKVRANPVNKEWSISGDMVVSEIFYKLIDINGQIVESGAISKEKANKEFFVGNKNLLPGHYVLQILNKLNTQIIKLMKN